MKLKEFKLKQILKLYLLNWRSYEYNNDVKKNNSSRLIDFNLIQIISDFKKALYVIFEYHQAHKKILFVGVPKKLELKINKLTHHLAVDHNFELRGVISNNLNLSNFTKVEKKLPSKVYIKSLIPKLLKKPDLIVLLLHEKNQNIIIESNLAKVPVITFALTDYSKTNLNKSSYNIAGFSQKQISTSERSLFFLGLNFLFKRIQKK